MKTAVLGLLLLLVATTAAAEPAPAAVAEPAAGKAAEPVRVAVTKDNSIVLVDNEWRDNAGRQTRIRIKGNQHLVAMMFDRKPLEGRVIRSAVLVCPSPDLAADAKGGPIKGLTLSTISVEWDEMKSNALTSGMQEAAGWGYPGARFPAVAGGNAFSLVCQAPSVVKDGAYHWDVHPDLVQAIALGAAHGLALHEWDADYSRNPLIYSREQAGHEPYLLVTFGPADAAPEMPKVLSLQDRDAADPAGMRVVLLAPPNGFLYEILVNGRPLPRWNIPFVRPGEGQIIPLRDVPRKMGEAVQVSVTVFSRSGKRTEPTVLKALGREVPAVPMFPFLPDLKTAGAPPQGLAVIPQEDKYDAVGKPVGDLPADYRVRNAVFDGQTIHLAAVRGEVVGFQALVQRAAGGAEKVTVKCDLPGLRTEISRAVYVPGEGGRRIPDPLVPVAADTPITLSANEAVPLVVDVFVPADFKGARAEGALTLSDGRKLPLALSVRAFALPAEAAFACEMNGYGLPDKLSEFYRLQEIAYDHRVHVNLLAYSHNTAAPGSRKSNMDMLMDFDPATGKAVAGGRRMDEKRYNAIDPGARQAYWDDFAKAFGPYLSGSYFKNGFRGPVPAPGFYLTFHESWPLNVRGFFSGNLDAYEAFKARPEYAATWVAILRDFLAASRREGWTQTGFQVYLNNKGSPGETAKAPWILDEPTSYWDYRALAYYADLARQARQGEAKTGLRFRIDLSRPEFDRGQLAGKADLWVVATDAFHTYHRLVADRAEFSGERIWIYGTTNRVEDSNRTVQAWVLDAYRGGACGVVPWQTINADGSALNKADPLGLFIFARDKDAAGRTTLYPSLRLKAYRRAAQDVEYLELLRSQLKWTPAQVRAFIDHYITLGGKVRVTSAEDAGTPQYEKVSPEDLRRLREAAAALIEKSQEG
jgi:hypothetical protein